MARSYLSSMPSKRLIFSYILDWVVIIIIAAIGGAWSTIRPYMRPFSLTDLSISYPYQDDQLIPVWLLIVITLVAPGLIIFAVCLLFVPGPAASSTRSRSQILRLKIWELNAGWLGLALALATAFATTQGAKLVFGKPRPHALAVCNPNMDAISQHTVGAYASGLGADWVLVSSGVCQQTDDSKLNDAFMSFPSGHASFSWAGMLYLTFFLCAKFAITIPYLHPRQYSRETSHASYRNESLPLRNGDDEDKAEAPDADRFGMAEERNQAAAPPVWTIAFVMIPLFVAVYICSTRYAQFYHFGWDLLAGSLIGIFWAYISFRLYHMPIARGAGWAWGARSKSRAFGIGVGTLSYVGPEGWGPSGAPSHATDVGRRSDAETV